MFEMKLRMMHLLVVFCYLVLVIFPLILAFDRLIWVSGFSPANWINSLEANFISQDVLWFTIKQAFLSTVVTALIAIPIAWQLGRYEWRFESLIKAVLTMPFVMPSIIVTMGFLQITGVNGLSIRDDSSTWLPTLIIAHAWFNTALFIRFCEPVLSNLNPKYLDQIRLLPEGRTPLKRVRNLWAPLLFPSIIAASCMTFVFSFTSFALVRWITLGDNSLESMMASIASSAGIQGYMINHNEIILGASLIQFILLASALWLVSSIQQKRQKQIRHSSELIVKSKNKSGWLVIGPAITFAILPMVTVFISSFRIRNTSKAGTYYDWNTSAWNFAFSNNYSLASANEAIFNSLGYAIITVLIALPVGWFLSKTIVQVEKDNQLLGRLLDLFVMIPFAVSSVMIGLGVMIGMIKIDPELFYSLWITPVFAHVMITTPFVVRILISSRRSIKQDYLECARVLGLNNKERLFKIELPMMKHSIFIAIIFVIAMSLGEFGASWVVTRNSEWTTLPILIDSLKGVPYNNSMTIPAACAIASILMFFTIITFTIAERFRKSNTGGMF